MTTFALLPGAGSDAWLWHLTVQALEGRGHRGIGIELPWAEETAGLPEFADAAAQQIGDDTEDLVIVGQSLGAPVATLLAARLPARQLVLLAPMVPLPGETAGEWWATTNHQDAIADVIAEHGPMSTWGQDALVDVFCHDMPPELARQTDEHSTGAGGGIFTSRLDLDAWPDVPTRVIACRDDRLFPLDFVRRITRERLDGLEADEIDGGHLAMLSNPEGLADQLVALRAQV